MWDSFSISSVISRAEFVQKLIFPINQNCTLYKHHIEKCTFCITQRTPTNALSHQHVAVTLVFSLPKTFYASCYVFWNNWPMWASSVSVELCLKLANCLKIGFSRDKNYHSILQTKADGEPIFFYQKPTLFTQQTEFRISLSFENKKSSLSN